MTSQFIFNKKRFILLPREAHTGKMPNPDERSAVIF
jgi:hypothetical protein